MLLQWAGIRVDEGPSQPGTVGPYVQSQRLERYRGHAQQLLDAGAAYRCFCHAERLQVVRGLAAR